VRVFLDTNVLVSAFATRGLSADVFRLVLAEHELIVARIVVDELFRVLRQKIGLPESAVREVLTTIEEHEVVPTAEPDPGVEVDDPPDARVLATALVATADVLVTGDRDFLSVNDRVEELRILDPRGFWEELR